MTRKKFRILTEAEFKKMFPQNWSAVWDKPMHYIFNKLAALTGMRHGELPGLRGELVSDTELKNSPFSCAGAYGLADKIRKNLLSSGYWEYGRGSSGY